MQEVENLEKWQECFNEARKQFKVADHMTYVTFPLLNDYRLLGKILVGLSEAASNLIKAFLYYEYSFKRVPLYRDPVMNLKTFAEKVAPRYFERENLDKIIQILDIHKKHKQSPMEFVKNDKFVILLGDKYETLTLDKIKEFVICVKKVLKSFPEQN